MTGPKKTLTAMAPIKGLLPTIIVPSSSTKRLFSGASPRVLKPGDVLKLARTYTEEDIVEYSKVSHDSNPLHFDPESARKAGFEDRLVHGLLVASLFPRIISYHFPGALYVSQSLQYKAPVYIGDEVIGEVQAVHLRENKQRYIAKFATRCLKNGGEYPVIDGEAMALLPTLSIEKAAARD